MLKLERIRQVAAVVPDLEPVIERLHALFAIDPSQGHERGEFGLTNAVLPIGGEFLELLQPIRDDVSAARYLQKRGPGFYMIIFESEEGLRAQREAEAADIPVVWVTNTDLMISVHYHPKSTGDCLISVDTSKLDGDWPAAGPEWKDHINSSIVTGIHVFRIAGPDAARMEAPFQRLFGMEPHLRAPRGDTAVARARVGRSGTFVDFVTPTRDDAHLGAYLRAHGPGPSGIEIQVRNLDDVIGRCDALGVRYRPRTGSPEQGWEALHINADDLYGLPITCVQSHGETDPWELDP